MPIEKMGCLAPLLNQRERETHEKVLARVNSRSEGAGLSSPIVLPGQDEGRAR